MGAGWSGLACAVAAMQAGWQVELFEAAHEAGGRARSLDQTFAGVPLDNGQHILLGAYRDTLALMRTVGINPDEVLLRMPLDLRTIDGLGLKLPAGGLASWKLLVGVALAKGWSAQDKWRLLRACWHWQVANFTCDATWSVSQLCAASQLTPQVVCELIEPLCLSALNTSLQCASAAVFLRVLHDAMFSGAGSSDLLIPKTDLGKLFPQASLQWLHLQGAQLHLGKRFTQEDLAHWLTESDEGLSTKFVNRALVLACPAWEAARLTQSIAPVWSAKAQALVHTAIATVYLQCHDGGFTGLPRPMVALHSHAQAPAQFAFDRSALCQQHGLLAAVVSASEGEREPIALQVQQQVAEQLGLKHLSVVQTIVEKRATFACLPNTFAAPQHASARPDAGVAPQILACGDYVRGPYPATLEGAVRSGQQVVRHLG
ncbi:MAG: hydroxysqualene dehydroxylase HpnE [Burkholderiales bacterium]|nr:hydroxysqualene dehydroxylase HpnE [Burkholderiales bacterium]